MNGIAKKDWPMKPPLENRQKRDDVDAWRLAHQTCRNGETKQPVSHGLAKGVALCGRMIAMERIVIT